VDVILSVNHDVWENAFLPKIPSGLQDRISEFVVSLEPLSRYDAMLLLASRDSRSADLIDQLASDQVFYARALLRHAGACWSESHHTFALGHAATGDIEAREERGGAGMASPEVFVEAQNFEELLGWNLATTDVVAAGIQAEPESVEIDANEPAFLQTSALESAGASFSTAATGSASNDFAAAAASVFSRSPIEVAEDFQSLTTKAHVPESAPQEYDRVADLLRQFRERYRNSS
jgi:hypothetical protein